jgi:hypothetical protein
MTASADAQEVLNESSCVFYRRVLQTLGGAGIEFLVGGAYALAHYTGIIRHTKDFDVFVRERDAQPVLDRLAAEGFRTELTFSHWLAKAFHDDDFCDVIFSSGNGVARVDDGWFARAPAAQLMGHPVRLCPAEEMIWSKAFVVERERYDGADINHLIRACGPDMDWRRVLWRFGLHWRVLLSHLVLFGFVYPGEQGKVPARVMQELVGRLLKETQAPPADRHLCQGTLLSRMQYLKDIEEWGYHDARQEPAEFMTTEEIHDWTEAGRLG